MKQIIFVCDECGKIGHKSLKSYTNNIIKGKGNYCSKQCYNKNYKRPPKKPKRIYIYDGINHSMGFMSANSLFPYD